MVTFARLIVRWFWLAYLGILIVVGLSLWGCSTALELKASRSTCPPCSCREESAPASSPSL